MKSDAFKGRLKAAIASESNRAFAERCGLSEGTVRRYLRGEAFPPLDTLEAIAEAGDVRIEWLASGEEPMRRGEEQAAPVDIAEQPDKHARAKEPGDGLTQVTYYDVEASAGHGAEVVSEQIIGHHAFNTRWLKTTMGLQPDKLAVIKVTGDSMQPTLADGCLILIDLRKTEVKDDAIYVLRLDSTLIAKRLQRMFDGSIKIKSDNPAYDEQVVPADQIDKLDVIGRVVWSACRM